MTATTFNPLATARELEAAGIERRQAEAIAEGMREAADAAASAERGDLADFATKADLAHFATKADLAHFATKADLYRALWIQAAALIGTQLAIAGFIVHLLSQP